MVKGGKAAVALAAIISLQILLQNLPADQPQYPATSTGQAASGDASLAQGPTLAGRLWSSTQGLCGASCPATRKTRDDWSGPFFFLQMADPQLGMLDGDKSFTRDAKLYEQAISDANRLKPACVVICGDLVNNCGIRAQHEEFARISRLLDKSIPLYLVAGNHDVQNAPTTQSVAGYRLLHGPDRYSFNLRGCHFVVLDSSLFYDCRNSPKEAAAQIEWLKDDLKQAAAAEPVHVFVFMHHPPYTRTLDEKDDYSQLPKERRQMVLDIFKGGGVTAVFTGHTHRNADAQPYGSVQLVNTSAVGKQLGAAQSGFRIVRVYKDTFQTDYVALDKCPQEVDMTLHAQTRPFATTRAAGAAAD